MAAVLGAVIVLAVSLGVRRLATRSDADDSRTETAAESSDSTPTTSTSPSSTPPSSSATTEPPDTAPRVETLSCPADINVAICDAAEFVQQTRGRAFRTFPDVEVLDDADFDQQFLADFDTYVDEFEALDVTWTAMGLIEPDTSLVDVYRGAYEVGVVGFYDPTDGRLVVRGDDLNLYAQAVLVHELTHAFDDQWLDLDREDFIDDEAEYGFLAVVEGNASRVEDLWRDQLDPAAAQQLMDEEFGSLSSDDIQRLLELPAVVQQLQGSPYLDGAVYVDRLVADGGEESVDDALATPPGTSEEILHPDLDRATEPEIVVAAPPADGEIVDEGRLGELMLRLWLGPAAGDGWGGDYFVAWQDGELSCIAVDLVGDDDGETAEINNAAQSWVEDQPDSRTVETLEIDGRQAVRAGGCS